MQKSYCFLSNYLTHHQLPFCLEMMQLTGGQFVFVETEDIPQERKNMGYATLGEQYDFVIHAQKSKEERNRAMEIAFASDVVIIGSAPDAYIQKRMQANKLTFRYSERIFKKGLHDMLRLAKYTAKTLPYRNKNLFYMLSSAYAAHDYYRCGAKPEKLFKWGYFPETKVYEDVGALMAAKETNSILWVGRMIDLKHPELAVQLASQLKRVGYRFTLTMIGSGPMEQSIKSMIEEADLQEQVKMLGAVNPDEVRRQMERHQIFLFTSDYNEGWGAVLNEAMNSGCAVVASHACGSVPFIISQGENGYAYEYGNNTQAFSLMQKLLDNPVLRQDMGRKALETVKYAWNAKTAAERFVAICNYFVAGKPLKTLAEKGILSVANPVLQKDMYLVIEEE